MKQFARFAPLATAASFELDVGLRRRRNVLSGDRFVALLGARDETIQ